MIVDAASPVRLFRPFPGNISGFGQNQTYPHDVILEDAAIKVPRTIKRIRRLLFLFLILIVFVFQNQE